MSLLSRKISDAPATIPSGSFTVDSGGEVLVGTLPTEWMREHAAVLGREIVDALAEAEAMGEPVVELSLEYSGLKISARNLRGGAVIFLLAV